MVSSPPAGLSRAFLLAEVLLVLGLSLGRSGIYAAVDLVAAWTAPGSLSEQTAGLNGSLAPGRPWLDLAYQLLGLGFGLVAVLLAAYLLLRSDEHPLRLWFGVAVRRTIGVDVGRALLVSAAVGGSGLAVYLVTRALGFDLTVVPESLPSVWWKIPVLLLSAAQNALLEELVVLGFVLGRLQQLGLSYRRAAVVCAVLRGSYHLYQGLGGFVGNLVMGLAFAWLYRRWGRLTPLIVTHTVLDVGAFVGFAVLAGHVSWLPGG